MTEQTYQEKPISVNAAARKYGIPQQTLSDWARRGRLKVLVRPERHGQKMLVDEASVVLARESYRPYFRGEGRWPGTTVTGRLPTPEELVSPPPTPEYSTVDLAEAYHRYGETIGFKPLTMEKHRQVLRVFAEKCPILPLTPEPILDFIHDLPVGMRTKKKYYEVIRQLYNYLQDFHKIPTPLTKRMVPRAERHPYARVLEREEVLKLFNAAENFQERMVLETLYVTRVRADELASLTSDNLFPDHIVVTGKTGTREVPISDDLHAALIMLGEGALFRDRSGKPITRDGVYQRVQKCMKAIGVTGKKLGPHALRHTSLTHLYEDTGDLLLVQEAAGHADLETTLIYTHPQAAKQREKLRMLDPIKRLSPAKRPPVGKPDAAELAAVLEEDKE